jgi:Ca-activated chloride channel family protein
MSQPAAILIGKNHERIALCDVSVTAALRDLLAEVTVAQTYRNDEKASIEAVYTFPLPLDAVLLDLSVTIGGRKLKGAVVEKKAAEARYEDAIADGNAAVMLEQLEPGLYTMNVGNLLPGETAVIAFTYAVTYRWAGDNLRMLIPTTIAPRYGESHFQPHQAPDHSLTVENQFSLQVEVFGSLREARFECPSHQVTLTTASDKTTIALIGAKASMDRDFILNVKAPQAAHSFALCGVDGAGDEAADAGRKDGAAVMASFQPVFPGLRQRRALKLAVVIDCSGSMQGDSITQAKQALAGILDGMQRGDRMTIVAFGNMTKALFAELLPCTDANLRFARNFAAGLEADMGGTEIGAALQVAYAATQGSESADIFLVTDGLASDWKRVVADAKKSGRRVFTVGVGQAVSEAFMRELAAVTGGGCELVSPQEGMADRVVRHFERMRAPRAKRVVVHWPEGARNQAPASFNTVFDGDTVVASAQFDRSSVTGHVVLEIETESGRVIRQELAIGQVPASQSGNGVSTVARLAAAARIKELDEKAAAVTAVQYQLASPWTNWLVVAERPDGEKALEIPEIRKVPNTLAAGWGGVGMAMPMASRATLGAALTDGFMGWLAEKAPKSPRPGTRPAARDNDTGEVESLLLEMSLPPQSHLPEQVEQLARDVAAMTDDARRAIDKLQQQTEELLERVTTELRELHRRADVLQRALEVLARAGSSKRQVQDAIVQLTEVRDRLHRLEKLLVTLERHRELLRQVGSVA